MIIRFGSAVLLGAFLLIASGCGMSMSAEAHMSMPAAMLCSESAHFTTYLLPVRENSAWLFVASGVVLTAFLIFLTFFSRSIGSTYFDRFSFFIQHQNIRPSPSDYLLEAFRRGVLHSRVY